MSVSHRHAREAEANYKLHRAGTDRVQSPERTLAVVEPLLDQFDITRVANLTGLDFIGIPVWACYRPNSRSLAVSQGKGLSDSAARASAIFESIESWHAERFAGPLTYSSIADLDPDRICDVRGLPRSGGRVLDPLTRILWADGTELFSNRQLAAPYELVHTDYRIPFPPGSGHFPPSSNGLASGNCWAEAVVHALCELIERDATAIWSHQSDQVRADARLDLSSVTDPDCRTLIDRFSNSGVDLQVWDTTTDLRTPCFVAVAMDGPSVRFRSNALPSAGMGCHPRKEVALARAITEAAQSRVTVISGARDDLGQARYEVNCSADLIAALKRDLPVRAGLDFDTIQTVDNYTVDEDIEHLLESLARIDLNQVIIFDLSREISGVSVVRAIVPGLEGSMESPGYTPGARVTGQR